MATFIAIGLFIVSVLGATMSRLLADELKAWTPSLVRLFIKLAVARLPEDQRERFAEEWQSDVNQLPGQIARLFFAFGYIAAACKITWLQENLVPVKNICSSQTVPHCGLRNHNTFRCDSDFSQG